MEKEELNEAIKLLQKSIPDKKLAEEIGKYLANNGFKVYKSTALAEKTIIIGVGDKDKTII